MTITVEEKSLQLALVKAAGQLGITQSQLAYKVINENTGFLGIFGRKVAVKAWKKEAREKPSSRGRLNLKSDENDHNKRDLSSKEIEELKFTLTSFCQEICSKMVGYSVEVDSTLDNDRLILNVEDDYLSSHLNRNGRLAESIEHILRKRPKNLRQELPFRVFVDMGGQRKKREIELVGMAKDLSNKVHGNKKPIVLNYRSSYDRKIIHMALDKDQRVYTKSIGSGPNRKLMILPNRSKDDLVHEEGRTGHSRTI